MAYKHDYDRTMTRLMVILQKLYEGESLSVAELAEEFGTSTRTIQRDFNEKLIQFPIEKVGRKWKMQEGFHLEKLKSVEDQLVLDVLEKFSKNLGSVFSLKAKNVLSQIKNPDMNHIYAKLDIEKIGDNIAEINVIEKAINNKFVLSVKYKTDKGSYSTEVKPLKIVNFEGFWYLLALECKNNELRKYHLKSLSNINVLAQTFILSKELNEALENAINIWFNLDNKVENVLLHVDEEIAKYFKRKPISKSQIISSIDSKTGDIELSIKITHGMEIIPTILKWMPSITVIEPQWLKDEISKRVKNYLKKTD